MCHLRLVCKKQLLPSQSYAELHTAQPTTLPHTVDPAKPRIPDTRTLDDCIRFWNFGDEGRGLRLCLKDWPSAFDKRSYRSEAVKWGRIQRVVDEFEKHCRGDRAVFDSQYPGLSGRYTKLVEAVDAARERRGELTRRPKRKRSGEQAAPRGSAKRQKRKVD